MVRLIWQCKRCGAWMHKVYVEGKEVPVLEIKSYPYTVTAMVVCPRCNASGSVSHSPEAPGVLWWEGDFDNHITDDEAFSYSKARGYEVADAPASSEVTSEE